MIDLLAALVSPAFGSALLSKILDFIIPSAQALLLAIVASRIAWTALMMSSGASDAAHGLSELGSHVVKAAVLSWILISWSTLSNHVMEEGPRLAARITGSGASPSELATKMVALVARFGDASLFGALDSAATASAQGTSTMPSSIAELLRAMALIVLLGLGQAVAAAIAVMLALPNLLLVLCLAVGPLAVAGSIGGNQLSAELMEGWAETTASAMLSLPVMAVLVVFLSAAPLSEPLMGARIGGSRDAAADIQALANDLAVLLVVGQLMFLVLPIASGLIQGRPPGSRSLVHIILALVFLPVRSLRAMTLATRAR